MSRRIILSCFFLVAVLIVSAAGTFDLSRQTDVRTGETSAPALPVPSKTDIATRLSYGYFDEWYHEMVEWSKEIPQEYTDEGVPIAFDASTFFNMKYLELLARDDLMEIEPDDIPEESTRKWDGYTKTNTGTYCDIYVETGSNSFESLKNEFDNKIWPSNEEAFGTVGFKIDVYVYYRDGGSPESDGGGGVGGFFTGSRPKRVYVDSADINGWGFEILAHEYQHLLHHSKDANENLWINEGCADWAIIKAYGQNAGGVRSHLRYFEAYPDNDLTRFDNYPYDYGSTAAWISYLADQYGGDTFTKALISNSGNGFNGVSNVLSSLGYSDNALDAYLNWLVANYLDDTSIDEGKYGYSNLNIKVDLEETYSSIPISDSSSVNRWGADYYKFRNGQEGFGLEFKGKGGGNDFAVWVVKMGSTSVEVDYMNLDASDYGKHPLPGFGSTFSTVIMIVTADEGANYDFGIIHMDTLPPVTTISVNPVVPDGKNGYYVTEPEISLSTEPLATTYYYWNDEENETNIYTSAFQVPEGINNLNFYSVDEYSNRELTRTYNYMVDTLLPETVMLLIPEKPDGPLFNGWYVTHPNIELSGEPEAKIFYKWDDGDEKLYDGNVGTLEGEHVLYYWSEDEAGNIEKPKEMILKIDTMAPITVADMRIDDSPVDSSEWYNETVRIELIADELVETLYSWDGDTFNLYNRYLESPEGEHVLSFYSIDEAGNQEYLKEVVIRTDTISPITTITLFPEEPDGTNGIYTSIPEIYFYSDDPEAVSYFYWDDQLPLVYDPLMDEIIPTIGSHNLSFYSVDTANNKEETQHIEIIIDVNPPITRFTREPMFPDGDNDWYNNITLELESFSKDVFKTYYYFDYDMKVREFQRTLGDELEDGEHVFYYYSVDMAGNRETPNSFIFKLDTTPPSAFFKPLTDDVEKGEVMTFSASESSDNMGVGTYKYIYGDGTFSNWVTMENVTHSYSKEGTFTAGLRVRDASGLESSIYQRRITITDKNEDDGGSGMMSFLPMSPAYQYIFLIIVSILVLVIILLVIYSSKRKKRKESLNEPDEEAENMEKEAIRLYGERGIRKRKTSGSRSGIMGPGKDAEFPVSDLEREPYPMFEDTSRGDALYISHGEIEEEYLLPENTSQDWESFEKYGEEDSIEYEDEGEYFSESFADNNYQSDFEEYPTMSHSEEEDWFSKNDEHDIVDLVPMRTDDSGKVMYASEDYGHYDGDQNGDDYGNEDKDIDGNEGEDMDGNESEVEDADGNKGMEGNEGEVEDADENKDMEGNEGEDMDGNEGEDIDGNEDKDIDGNEDKDIDGNEGEDMDGNEGEDMDGNEGEDEDESMHSYGPEAFTDTDWDEDAEEDDSEERHDTSQAQEGLESWNL